jgi:hypothetical protein
MRNCWVKVLRRVRAHPGACFGGNVHCVLSQSYSCLTNGTLHKVHRALRPRIAISQMFSTFC